MTWTTRNTNEEKTKKLPRRIRLLNRATKVLGLHLRDDTFLCFKIIRALPLGSFGRNPSPPLPAALPASLPPPVSNCAPTVPPVPDPVPTVRC